jgi:DNA repair protein RecN (Recombination protein N)
MLIQLDIQNVALIDRVNIELGKGLNLLTGETGAGKSIIIDSINAVLGERVTKDLIRTGKDRALVEAVFQIDNARFSDIFTEMGMEPEEDGTLILSREINQSGKNICRINGKMATVSMLKSFGERIIDIHGQYDNQSLLKVENHLSLLDSFGGGAISGLLRQYAGLLEEYRETKSRLKSVSGDIGERERKTDLLRFQIDEIKKARLKKNEEEDLNRQRILLSNSEKVANSLTAAYELLFSGNNIRNSSYDNTNEAIAELNSIAKLDERFESLVKRLQDVAYQMDDIIEDIRKEKDGTEYNPELLEEIEERLDLIYRLKRKYGASTAEVLEYCDRAEAQLEGLRRSEETAAGLEKKLRELDGELFEAAEKLHALREAAARLLEEKIGSQLDELEMKRAKFKVDIQFDRNTGTGGERKFLQNGLDRVEFLISPNVGEPLKPLARIASGGEMSRIMLAVKTILADVDDIPTLIFDEIDIGISGKASQKVGEKLSFISKNHQVLCVTHLAQIACMADRHYLIEKVAGEDTTRTFVRRLEGGEITDELARLLGGSAGSDASVRYAREMLENAVKYKGG